jgi:DNA mismatch repair protein MutL
MSAKESVDLLAKYQKAPVIKSEPEARVDSTVTLNTVPGAINDRSDTEVIPEYKYVGEAFDCYLIIERDGELLIIDKHAAHERIIFEDLKRGRNMDNRIGSQGLMLPITVLLTPDEHSSLNEYGDEMRALGFDFSISDRSADITAIPDTISHSDAEGLFVSMLGELSAGEGNPEITDLIRRERALYQLACKAAIKGGRIYDKSVTDWIIGKVLLLPDITVCPHGRPIAYKLKKSELDRQFERIK